MPNLLHYIVIWQFEPTVEYRSLFNDTSGFTIEQAETILHDWDKKAVNLGVHVELQRSSHSGEPNHNYRGYIDGKPYVCDVSLSPAFEAAEWQRLLKEEWDIRPHQLPDFPFYVNSPVAS